MTRRHLLALVAALGTLGPGLALAQLDMELFGGKKPPPFFHPRGFYSLSFPGGWEHRVSDDGNLVANKTAGDRAELTITLKSVPHQVDTEMVAHNAGLSLRQLPHFVDRGGGRLRIGGKPASVRSFEFDYQGNTEYTVSVEELYIVSGAVLFTVHFEVLKRSFPRFGQDLKTIYDSIAVAEIDAEGKPIAPVLPRAPAKGKDNVWVPGPTGR